MGFISQGYGFFHLHTWDVHVFWVRGSRVWGFGFRAASERRGNNLKRSNDFTWQPRPESGLDDLSYMCHILSTSRPSPDTGLKSRPVTHETRNGVSESPVSAHGSRQRQSLVLTALTGPDSLDSASGFGVSKPEMGFRRNQKWGFGVTRQRTSVTRHAS